MEQAAGFRRWGDWRGMNVKGGLHALLQHPQQPAASDREYCSPNAAVCSQSGAAPRSMVGPPPQGLPRPAAHHLLHKARVLHVWAAPQQQEAELCFATPASGADRVQKTPHTTPHTPPLTSSAGHPAARRARTGGSRFAADPSAAPSAQPAPTPGHPPWRPFGCWRCRPGRSSGMETAPGPTSSSPWSAPPRLGGCGGGQRAGVGRGMGRSAVLSSALVHWQRVSSPLQLRGCSHAAPHHASTCCPETKPYPAVFTRSPP